MYVAVAVGSIQGKNRLAVVEGESKNSQVTEGGISQSDKNIVKRNVEY